MRKTASPQSPDARVHAAVGTAVVLRFRRTPNVRRALERGDSTAAIVGADAAAVEAFKKERAKILLY
jgi:hypothetical protein